MKKISFLFALLAGITASATVTVTPIAADYSSKEVTFKVAWSGTVTPYNNRVWIWIDFCPVTGTTPATSFSTATVSNPTKTAGNGTITGATTRGFFIEYANATNAGTTVTATLSNAPAGKFNWCAYGSDYPPNATMSVGGGYTLRGTKPFTINGSLNINSNAFGADTCITSITDPTGRPDGIIPAAPTVASVTASTLCAGNTSSLTATLSGGTTTAMTYTWNIGGTQSTTTVRTQTTQTLNANTAYTVTVTNANGCKSANRTGTISIGNCALWTTCSGFSYVVLDVTIGNTNWNDQCYGGACACYWMGTDWRLPTIAEFNCMCSNKTTLPGGYVTGRYWLRVGGDGFLAYFTNCSYGYTTNGGIAGYTKCVK